MPQSPQIGTVNSPRLGTVSSTPQLFILKNFKSMTKLKDEYIDHPYVLHLAPPTVHIFATFASSCSLHIYTFIFLLNYLQIS